MELLWFAIIAIMLAVYVVLDGFDIGAGILHLFIAKTDEERRTLLATIAPVWDGNEVWLLAAGGTLYFAFPLLYASSFSGFYLPLMIVLWLLMLRAAGIEMRHQVSHPMWKAFWDATFGVSSILLAIFFGAALGNVVRGVPIGADGYFFAPLWTTFTVVPEAGILDWFTVLMGIVALTTLGMHGALYIAVKSAGEIQGRARSAARLFWWLTLFASAATVLATFIIRASLWANFVAWPAAFLLPGLGLGGLLGVAVFLRKENDRRAFASSALFILAQLAATAFGLFPVLLTSSLDPRYSITIYTAAAGSYGLGVGVVWWIAGIILATGYFVYLYRSFRGKVSAPAEHDGY
jgi:cytochrome d ubiquinol oxidase subunit II